MHHCLQEELVAPALSGCQMMCLPQTGDWRAYAISANINLIQALSYNGEYMLEST